MISRLYIFAIVLNIINCLVNTAMFHQCFVRDSGSNFDIDVGTRSFVEEALLLPQRNPPNCLCCWKHILADTGANFIHDAAANE